MNEVLLERVRRRKLLATSLKLERKLKYLRRYGDTVARQRLVNLYRRTSPFEWVSI